MRPGRPLGPLVWTQIDPSQWPSLRASSAYERVNILLVALRMRSPPRLPAAPRPSTGTCEPMRLNRPWRLVFHSRNAASSWNQSAHAIARVATVGELWRVINNTPSPEVIMADFTVRVRGSGPVTSMSWFADGHEPMWEQYGPGDGSLCMEVPQARVGATWQACLLDCAGEQVPSGPACAVVGIRFVRGGGVEVTTHMKLEVWFVNSVSMTSDDDNADLLRVLCWLQGLGEPSPPPGPRLRGLAPVITRLHSDRIRDNATVGRKPRKHSSESRAGAKSSLHARGRSSNRRGARPPARDLRMDRPARRDPRAPIRRPANPLQCRPSLMTTMDVHTSHATGT